MIIYGESRQDPVFVEDVGLTPENTWLIFGCSNFITDIKRDIPDLLKTYRSIELNAFPRYFKGCEFLATLDKNNHVKKHRGSKFILGLGKNETLCREYHKEIDIAYMFKSCTENVILEDSFKWIDRDNFECVPGKLLCKHTIAHPAINYALLQGTKNVVLVGVDLSSGWKHFYDKNLLSVNIRQAHHRKLNQKRMINLLKKLSKHINIYNINPHSETEMPIVSIEEVLNV